MHERASMVIDFLFGVLAHKLVQEVQQVEVLKWVPLILNALTL